MFVQQGSLEFSVKIRQVRVVYQHHVRMEELVGERKTVNQGVNVNLAMRVNFVNCALCRHVIVKMVEYVLETNAFALQVMSGTSVRKWTPVVDTHVKIMEPVKGRAPTIMPVPVQRGLRDVIVRRGTMHVLHSPSRV